MSIEEKTPLMIEWWHKGQALLLASNLNKSMVRDLVLESKLELRKGVRQFIGELLREKIPILIFSAGLGDVIEVFLDREVPEFTRDRQSAHIVSNFIQYNAKGNLRGFSEKLIHSFNKNEHEIQDTSYCQSISNRSNVILLGDTLGDVGMIGGMKNLKNILKIGFLNRSTPAKLNLYMSVFDIVICDNPTFDLPNVILNNI
jgi:cytosolic 5'-nucleotidase 3